SALLSRKKLLHGVSLEVSGSNQGPSDSEAICRKKILHGVYILRSIGFEPMTL
ncbi:unnamed protein product, partial [Larinioides sclopetarius]